jgi:hypothetical protein
VCVLLCVCVCSLLSYEQCGVVQFSVTGPTSDMISLWHDHTCTYTCIEMNHYITDMYMRLSVHTYAYACTFIEIIFIISNKYTSPPSPPPPLSPPLHSHHFDCLRCAYAGCSRVSCWPKPMVLRSACYCVNRERV